MRPDDARGPNTTRANSENGWVRHAKEGFRRGVHQALHRPPPLTSIHTHSPAAVTQARPAVARYAAWPFHSSASVHASMPRELQMKSAFPPNTSACRTGRERVSPRPSHVRALERARATRGARRKEGTQSLTTDLHAVLEQRDEQLVVVSHHVGDERHEDRVGACRPGPGLRDDVQGLVGWDWVLVFVWVGSEVIDTR